METRTEIKNIIEFDLNELCRTCLSKTDKNNMIKLSSTNQQQLIIMLNSIGKFETEFNHSHNLCKICEEKLIISYNFQQLIQKSEEIIRQYFLQSKNKFDEKIEFNEIQLTSSESESIDKPPTTNKQSIPMKKPRLPTNKKPKKPRRLPQYSSEEVAKAIERSKAKFHENRRCIKCHFIGSNVRALSVHMTHLHKELKEFWCWICNSQVTKLNEHYTNEHLTNELKCEFCTKSFMNKGHLIEHLRSHSTHRPYKCPNCTKCFISAKVLKTHYRIHTNERPYGCRHCSAKFRQLTSLKLHSKRHTEFGNSEIRSNETTNNNNGVEETNVDLKNFLDIKIEPEIMELSTAPSTLVEMNQTNFCELCNRRVKSITIHTQKYHTNSEGTNCINNKKETSDPALCNTCGRQFKTNSKLRLHMRIHTGEAPYKCSYCDKRMSSRNHLVVHERTHTGEKPHVCNICGKAFAQSSVLGTHMKIHTGKPEICNICQQGFCRPAELRVHMRKHSGEKPFLCTECGQGFKQHSHLMGHLRTHSDERPYKCDQCERTFKHMSSLKSHLQIHSGAKPFKCSQCPYACRQSYSLTQHMRLHTIDTPRPEKPHICLICNKNYNTIAMLMSHTSSAHSVIN